MQHPNRITTPYCPVLVKFEQIREPIKIHIYKSNNTNHRAVKSHINEYSQYSSRPHAHAYAFVQNRHMRNKPAKDIIQHDGRTDGEKLV